MEEQLEQSKRRLHFCMALIGQAEVIPVISEPKSILAKLIG